MGLIPAFRTQMPVVDVGPASPSAESRVDQRQPQGRSTPVGESILPDAPQQVPARLAATDPQLMAARDTSETSAAATAEAARAAYIKASIAAGISPLPMP